jgi:defect-in-organelle-trafficking protein DotC
MNRGRTRTILLATTGLAAVLLSGCVQTVKTAPVGPEPVVVNPAYRAGYVQNLDQEYAPSLDEVVSRLPSRPTKVDPAAALRSPALQDAALSYGAQAGLAWESKAINRLLQAKSNEISRIYDFNRVMIEAPTHAMIVPPVISQADESWETSDAGRTLRVADTVFEIVEQARFVPTPPVWQSYLLRTYKSPEAPSDILLPENGKEKTDWKRWVADGYGQGRQQARDIFESDLNRLERDFTGMVRYKTLLEEGKVSPPSIANSTLGTTGSGEDMRVNDRAVTITQDPKLKVTQPEEFRAPVTTPGTDGVPTGKNPALPRRAPTGSTASTAEVQEAIEASVSRTAAETRAPATSGPKAGRRAW